jgi:hypothetical protein
VAVAVAVVPQTHTRSQRRSSGKATTSPQPKAQPTPPVPETTREPSPATSPAEEPQEVDTLKIDTDLVTVPVIATTVEGNYLPDLRQEEFSISEDGEKQQVAFFATVSTPFHVVLMLDTSASTQDKLRLIQQAAVTFVEQLQNADRVKLISFDDTVRELSDFTNDRAALRKAIYQTVSGRGTKLYDAFELALSSIKQIRGRKAIVLFSDGVDWHSDQATFDSTLHWLDEEGVIVYPIRYETRAQSERIAREAQDDASLPTIDVVRKAPSGTTAPTFPSDDPSSVPTSGQTRKTGPLGLPTAAEIMRGRRQRDPDMDRYPSPDRVPPTDPRDGGPTAGDPRGGTFPTGRGSRRKDDSVSVMLDQLYLKADSYLLELANKSGGRLLRADTLGSLPDAFARIAAELRTQYAIGYYPTNKTRDGQYRKIKVTTTRKNVVVRARPGYRARSGG